MSGQTVHALAGVDLRIDAGEFVAVTGPSGSGKSSLLNILGCLDHPSSGRYLVEGRDVATLDDEAGSDIRNRRLRSEEHTSELQSLLRNSYAVFCLKKKKK